MLEYNPDKLLICHKVAGEADQTLSWGIHFQFPRFFNLKASFAAISCSHSVIGGILVIRTFASR